MNTAPIKMRAYKIGNDIVAADNPAKAITTWADHFSQVMASAPHAFEVDPDTFAIDIENEDGTTRPGFLREIMPAECRAEVLLELEPTHCTTEINYAHPQRHQKAPLRSDDPCHR